jgi:hypothetical protein
MWWWCAVATAALLLEAVRALYQAAGKPKARIWLTTGHLLPTDRPLIRALVDTTLARLPVLRGERVAAGSSLTDSG